MSQQGLKGKSSLLDSLAGQPIFGGLGGLGAAQGRSPVFEQQMHAQQQMNDLMRAQVDRYSYERMRDQEMRMREELERHRLDAMRYMVSGTSGKITIADSSSNTIEFEPDIDRLPIREYLQRRVDKWLATVNL